MSPRIKQSMAFDEDDEDGRKERQTYVILAFRLALACAGVLLLTATMVVVLLDRSSTNEDISASISLDERDTYPNSTLPSSVPTGPSLRPKATPSSRLPTYVPSLLPTDAPSPLPTTSLTTRVPSWTPTSLPSVIPSVSPSAQPSETIATFFPGRLVTLENDLLLSQGLTSRIIAQSGTRVQYHASGQESPLAFHPLPDFGGTFPDTRGPNPGGWIYVSNSEVKDFEMYPQKGGVGAITFDQHGNVIDYRQVLSNTEANCGGGKTPWGAWISCEEHANGNLWQVDPTGERPAKRITLGNEGGFFESFAYDLSKSHFFVTEDAESGPLRRFTPTSTNNQTDDWDILDGPGETEYLLLSPTSDNGGTFTWTSNQEQARANAKQFYQNSEGIDISGRRLFFVSKVLKTIFILHLDDLYYTQQTTVHGLFDGAPDQVQRIVQNDDDELLFFTEEGGKDPGVHARNSRGQFFTILESPVYNDETTGLAFSPNGKHMYVAFQETGLLYEITRMDGLAFHARNLNVKFHAV